MFVIVRIIIGCLFLVCAILLIKKQKAINKRLQYILLVALVIAFVFVSMFIPFENIFITFSSPEAVYRYTNIGGSGVNLIVEGQSSDFVIGDSNGSDTYLIVPKTTKGWKLGLGANIKRVEQRIANGIVVYVFQYKNTSDYYITVIDTNGGHAQITDNRNSTFVSLEQRNESLEKTFVTYYTNISKFDSQYHIIVNGEKITFYD